MTIVCGNDKISLSEITHVTTTKISHQRLQELEEQHNGAYLTNSFGNELSAELEIVINKYWYEIGIILRKHYGPRWNYAPRKKSSFKIEKILSNGDANIVWQYHIEVGEQADGSTIYGNNQSTISLKDDIVPALRVLANTPPIRKKQKVGSFLGFMVALALDPSDTIYHDDRKDTPTEMPQETANILKKYESILAAIDKREKERVDFLEQYSGKSILIISTQDRQYVYLEGYCGFDIFKKETEIQKHRNSINRGEQTVEYALKWANAVNCNHMVTIKGDCESKYRYDCIVLNNPDFINDPQEYDHILVCSAGIVLIETKNWKGYVEIRPDGKWIRKTEVDSPAAGIESPKFQMRRHEAMMKSILPNVPVHSLLCFSNVSIVIDGKENFCDYPILTIEQLEETLSALCNKGTYAQEDIDRMVATIEAHKVYKPNNA